MEQEQERVTAEYDALTKELAACKEEYDSFERKDIQYHENMKAQKANLKKLRAKEKENTASVEAKTKSVAEMEEALARLEKKEAAEAALAAMLDRFKEEINGLKAKKKEIEVGVREGGDAQTTLAPLQERFSMQDASLQEKRTELEILGKKRANCEKVCAELATLLANQTRLVRVSGEREA